MAAPCLPDRPAATTRHRSRRRIPVRALSATHVAALLVVAVAGPVFAQAPKPYQPPSGPTPRTAKGTVDLSGVWEKPYVPDMTKDGKNQKGFPDLPFTPWGEHEWKTYDAAEGDY